MRLALAAAFALANGWFAVASPRLESLPTSDASKRGRAVLDVCNDIREKVSNDCLVSFPPSLLEGPLGNTSYEQDIYHQSASSTEMAACSVRPDTAQDVAEILKIVGDNRTPFAVKGGGHAMNVGFSSTTGVQIAMSRFKQIEYDPELQVVHLGAGLIWDEVYTKLDPMNVTVAGGRAKGVGVAGFILHGGYSFLANQHGLTIDTVIAYELVQANGTIRAVTAANADLFWALKGGGNNLGIVTKFTLKAFPYTQVWGGLITTAVLVDRQRVVDAIIDFEKNVKDPKAAILPSFIIVDAVPIVATILFYFGPTAPPGIFDKFLNIPGIDIRNIGTRKMMDLLDATPFLPTKNKRGAFHTVSVPADTRELLEVVLAESRNAVIPGLLGTVTFIGYHIEPFLEGFLNNTGRTSDSAFPPTRKTGLPLNVFYSWESPTSDSLVINAMKASVGRLEQTIPRPLLPRYPNYSLAKTPLEEMYGPNVARLRAIAQAVDPRKTMMLAGGFKVQIP